MTSTATPPTTPATTTLPATHRLHQTRPEQVTTAATHPTRLRHNSRRQTMPNSGPNTSAGALAGRRS
eukprot:9185829-Pyramimonas_sp.AAC.1